MFRGWDRILSSGTKVWQTDWRDRQRWELKNVFFIDPPTSVGISPTVSSEDGDWSCPQNDVFHSFFLTRRLGQAKILNNSKYLTFFEVSGSHSDVHGNSSRLGCYVMSPSKSHLEDVGVDGRITLKLILKRMRERRLD
jgi:hypothetical protein